MTLTNIQNTRRWAPTGPRGWLAAAAALIAASAIRELLHPFLGPASPGIVFSIAAALIEYYYGLAPALAAMVLGLGLADYLFVPPYGDFAVLDQHDVVLVATYPVVTLLIIVLIERLRRSQYRSELIGAVAQSRYEILLRADNERLLASKSADETHRLLRTLTDRHHELIFIQAIDRETRSTAPVHSASYDDIDADADRVAAATTDPAPSNADADAAHHAPAAGSMLGDRAAAILALGNATQPGNRFGDVHPDDIERTLNVLTPGPHRVRLRDASGYQLTDAICERFATPNGDFFILRLDR